MNATVHANLSCKQHKTTHKEDFDFFYKIHDFMDCSKEVESSNLHRCLTHHLFFIKQVAIPIFGSSYTAKNGKIVNIKDDLEQNHVIADFRGFIPTLSDYTMLINADDGDEELFNNLFTNLKNLEVSDTIIELLKYPFYNTGDIKSLWITCNSWFLCFILPKIHSETKDIPIKDLHKYSPSIMFNRMKYDNWIQNGEGKPPSFKKIEEFRNTKRIFNPKDGFRDGQRGKPHHFGMDNYAKD